MKIVELEDFNLERQGKTIIRHGALEIARGEQILLSGASGSGKTSLGMALAGQLFAKALKCQFNFVVNGDLLPKVSLVSQFFYFKDKTGLSDFYYQQRYNSYDSEHAATVRETLDYVSDDQKLNELLGVLNLIERLDAPLIQLSSGERKKLQLILALRTPSQIMILDNPYIGLDVNSRDNLIAYLTKLACAGVTFIIIDDDIQIPSFITHVIWIDATLEIQKVCREDYVSLPVVNLSQALQVNKLELAPLVDSYAEIVKLEQVTIKYGAKLALNKIDWLVLAGQKWLVSGQNGAGKSTLLSLINGDHPQAYANEIYLFERKRGSGESIWEIKQKIGFVSPELHWNFDTSMTCLETILSGYFDTPGLYHKTTSQQQQVAHDWLTRLELTEYAAQRFALVSNGIQRMLLLLRALIKNPPLFILDEPCQGLDDRQTANFVRLVDDLFADSQHTIIYVSHRADQIPACISHRLCLEHGESIPCAALEK